MQGNQGRATKVATGGPSVRLFLKEREQQNYWRKGGRLQSATCTGKGQKRKQSWVPRGSRHKVFVGIDAERAQVGRH